MEEAAEIIGVSYSLMRRWASRGKIETTMEKEAGKTAARHVIAPEEIARIRRERESGEWERGSPAITTTLERIEGKVDRILALLEGNG